MKVSALGSRLSAVLRVALLVPVLSAHVGSPDVFFSGKAGAYDIRVIVRPPEVVPGIARVTVHVPADVQRVAIRPVFWRAGSKGAPAADDVRKLEGSTGTFEGSLWLMARGAFSVDVIVEGAQGKANVLVPVAAVATGRLALDAPLAALLMVMGFVLIAGLVNIVYKAAGESLVEEGSELEAPRKRRARVIAALAVPILALAVFGGAKWWNAVDVSYERTMYRPSPLGLKLEGNTLRIHIGDTLSTPPRRVSALMPDHGKLMHLFMIRADDAHAFAHLHPVATDSSAQPDFTVAMPPLPAGTYHIYGDVVHETGFERTLVASLALGENRPTAAAKADPDDAWYVGDASRTTSKTLADGSTMTCWISREQIRAGQEETIRVTVTDKAGKPAQLEPYLGMSAHAVVERLDGNVYVHLHPLGTVTMAAQQAFAARDRGDTTSAGRLVLGHDMAMQSPTTSNIEFPYAFPKAGSYRIFVQVKRAGRVMTGAFAVNVAKK